MGRHFERAGVPCRLLCAVAISACASHEPSPPPSESAGVAHDLAEAERDDQQCTRCHVQIAAEWLGSEHHASDDATFRASLAREAVPEFCRGCHAPFADSTATLPAAAGNGVSCSSCHQDIRLGPLGHPRPAQSNAADANGACARCHEFAFPGLRQHPEKLQLTVSEHAASSYAGTPCVTCHMPPVPEARAPRRAHASHAFAEARSESALRAALAVQSERATPTRVRLTLRSQRVGHAFPTGDLFRRLLIEADTLGPDYAVLAHAQRQLARHFGDLPAARDRLERVALVDDRVQPDVPTVVELELGAAAAGRPISWRVRYERVLHLDPKREEEAVVESSVLLASGTLPEKP